MSTPIVENGTNGANGVTTPQGQPEQELWASFPPSAWSDSINNPSSTFSGLYMYTTSLIEEELRLNEHDIILEVGCGTGEVISSITTDLPRVGVDINETFIAYCKKKYPEISFDVVDATELVAWWRTSPFKDFKSPLILCCNNTMNIIPASIRYRVTQEMRHLCKNKKGRVMVSYWNGRYFSHGVRDYYMKNPSLCGPVDIESDVDWKTNTLLTASGYHTQWLNPEWVMRLLKCYDLDPQYSTSLINEDCLIAKDLGIFVFFTNHTSGARDLYDSMDAHIFYSVIWGQGTAHLGRYDDVRLSSDPIVLANQVVNAQALHEEDFCDAVRSKIEHCDGKPIPCRFLDLGCGFGGLLRKFRDYGFLRNGTGVDFSARMCKQCDENNKLAGMHDCIDVRNESFLDTSLGDEVVDVCVSLEAFLHVGLDGQERALREAYRVLRPGGWLLFSDVMERPGVDPADMVAFYKNLHIDKLGSVEYYTRIAEKAGFKDFSFTSHAKHVGTHYQAIHRMVLAYRNHPDPARRLSVSDTFYQELELGMKNWADSADGKIEWGIFTMRKV